MAEKVIDRRKSQLFLHNLSPVTNTYDEVVKQKLTRGKFPLTKTGIIKMMGLMILSGSILSYLLTENTCSNKDYGNVFLLSASTAAVGQLILFIIFSFGWTTKRPGIWINMDIFFNLIISLLTIVSAALSIKFCQGKNSGLSSKVSEALGICGSAIILFISCPALFLMYRFVEYMDPSAAWVKNGQDTRPRKSFLFRKSIFA